MFKKLDADLIGSIASVVCLIHCLFMPWVLMFSGAWLSQYFSHPLFHHLMLIVALLIGVPVFLRSYFRYNSKLVLFLGVLGLSLTSYGTFIDDACCPHELEVKTPTTDCTDCDSIIHSSETDLELHSLDIDFTNTETDFKAVPWGVAFILFAHILNFKHRKKCKIRCCAKPLS
ncbi:MerC domain-containing protein [Lentisphaera marina]|uniref:MerC domain-containing protein n=1 Tax=Lentisphaera marina TaxID=1111041 RepID=UPI00236651AC|nr:MerC domain-containing protein [Lentisphaera marina]MDD7986095.1 MerC domain-containing protein [Lentisphaera marina]